MIPKPLKMLYSTIISLTVAALQFSQNSLAYAIPEAAPIDLIERGVVPADHSKVIPFPFDDDDAPTLEHAFGLIHNIPDHVFDAGEGAVKDWIQHHGGHPSHHKNQVREAAAAAEANAEADTSASASVSEIEARSWLAVAKCALAIGQAIIENEIPIAKLRRLKELIKLLGGAKKVAKLLLKAKSLRQLLVIGGPELAELGEILLGYQAIVGACFSWI